MTKIRAIHSFGPPVGKWVAHGTVAETIAKEKRRLREEADRQQQNDDEAKQKTVTLNRRTK